MVPESLAWLGTIAYALSSQNRGWLMIEHDSLSLNRYDSWSKPYTIYDRWRVSYLQGWTGTESYCLLMLLPITLFLILRRPRFNIPEKFLPVQGPKSTGDRNVFRRSSKFRQKNTGVFGSNWSWSSSTFLIALTPRVAKAQKLLINPLR
jgi:hypothetical protein